MFLCVGMSEMVIVTDKKRHCRCQDSVFSHVVARNFSENRLEPLTFSVYLLVSIVRVRTYLTYSTYDICWLMESVIRQSRTFKPSNLPSNLHHQTYETLTTQSSTIDHNEHRAL
jgi:hypothetical protein